MLPSETQLKEMAKTADTFAISKTIQTLLTDQGLACESKLIYLSELRSIISTSLIGKKVEKNRIETLQKNAQEQIKRLLL